jgi:chemotaxis protein CheX
MDVKYLNPFLDAAAQVMQVELQLDITRGNITMHNGSHTTDDVAVLINIVGQIQGVVLLELSRATGTAFVSKMMGQAFTEFDNLAQSGIAELGNVISGKATMELSNTGIDSTISPPTMIIGKNTQISTMDFPRLVVPLSTELGTITVHLAVRESPPDQQHVNFVPLIQRAVTIKPAAEPK